MLTSASTSSTPRYCCTWQRPLLLTFLAVADWDKRHIFVDALDPWLVAIYVDAWLAVLATPIVACIAFRTWRQADAGPLTRSYFTVVAVAMLVSA
jgi:hypothetical protein